MQCFVKFKYSKKFAKADLFFKNNDCAFIQFYEPAYPLVENEADGAVNDPDIPAAVNDDGKLVKPEPSPM